MDAGAGAPSWRSAGASTPAWLDATWWRRLGRGFHVVLAFVLAGLAWGSSYPGGWSQTFWLLLALGVCGLAWIAGVAVGLIHRGQHRSPSLWCLLVAPLAVLGSVGVSVLDIPLRARWVHARSAFAAVADGRAEDVAPGQDRELDVQQVGSYRIQRAYQRGDALVLEVEGAGTWNTSGFAYLPHGPDADVLRGYELPSIDRVEGDWYTWSSQF